MLESLEKVLKEDMAASCFVTGPSIINRIY